MDHGKDFQSKVSVAGLLIAMGIVFGDLGTSPLYTLNAVFNGKMITETAVLGVLSCIFWTLTCQTTIKYVVITMQADNHGEGGIFSLYALVRRYFSPRLVLPAMAGAAFLIADGIITPPISVTSAIEGLKVVSPHINVVPIVILILVGLFFFQQFGSEKIGKIFGPVMMVWFLFIGYLGIININGHYEIFKALNPYYAYNLLVHYPKGFWLLGAIFLCTTGAEALYSDMGHAGRANIRVSWIFIKIMLLLCYAGQCVWLLEHQGQVLDNIIPFYAIVPKVLFWPSLAIATLATIIASQALISGCFTLINEAIRLGLWPRQHVLFPTNFKGQLYIPFVNWMLMFGCIGMVLHFRESTKMEAAFGLSVTLTMLMSTVLIAHYMIVKKYPKIAIALITLLFLTIEGGFLYANSVKVKEGGWITLVIGALLFLVMFVWMRGREIRAAIQQWVAVKDASPELVRLSEDMHITDYATNLVYLAGATRHTQIERTILRSIFRPSALKKSQAYWMAHINVTDEPYTLRYRVQKSATGRLYFINFDLGFRIEPRIGLFVRQVISDMIASGEIAPVSSVTYFNQTPIDDCKFVITDSYLSIENDMPYWKNLLMRMYYMLKKLSVRDEVNYGLDESSTIVEKYPVIITPYQSKPLTRYY